MRVLVSHDYIAPKSDRWRATAQEYDLGVPVGSGATPLQAIEDLLWRLDDETTVPEQVTIEWVD